MQILSVPTTYSEEGRRAKKWPIAQISEASTLLWWRYRSILKEWVLGKWLKNWIRLMSSHMPTLMKNSNITRPEEDRTRAVSITNPKELRFWFLDCCWLFFWNQFLLSENGKRNWDSCFLILGNRHCLTQDTLHSPGRGRVIQPAPRLLKRDGANSLILTVFWQAQVTFFPTLSLCTVRVDFDPMKV